MSLVLVNRQNPISLFMWILEAARYKSNQLLITVTNHWILVFLSNFLLLFPLLKKETRLRK